MGQVLHGCATTTHAIRTPAAARAVSGHLERVHAKRHLRSLPKPRDHSAEASGAYRRSPLAQEYAPARLLLALKATQGAQFLSEGERLLAVEVAAIGDGIASKLPCIS
jgi:hypothetical protein